MSKYKRNNSDCSGETDSRNRPVKCEKISATRVNIGRLSLKKVFARKSGFHHDRIKRHRAVYADASRDTMIKMLENLHKMGTPGLSKELDEVIDKLTELDDEELRQLLIASSFGDI